jgi:hypothetical protein
MVAAASTPRAAIEGRRAERPEDIVICSAVDSGSTLCVGNMLIPMIGGNVAPGKRLRVGILVGE